MRFWSKGLGKKTINLYLSKGETIKSGDSLYVKGQMEAPVDWEYIMPMQGDDIVDFLDLLSDPAIARYIHASPDRWQLYWAMISQGLLLAASVAVAGLKHAFGGADAREELPIEVPPPSQMKQKKRKAAARKASEAAGETVAAEEEPQQRRPRRKRLSKRTTSAPSLTSSMKPSAAPAFLPLDQEDPDAVAEAMQDAMEAAESIA